MKKAVKVEEAAAPKKAMKAMKAKSPESDPSSEHNDVNFFGVRPVHWHWSYFLQ